VSRRDYEPGRVTPSRMYLRGKITIVKVGRRGVHATVGDHGMYDVTYINGKWSCSCGLAQPCNHVAAVALVIQLPMNERHLPWAVGVPV
jgi:hypothetical protein